MSCLPSAKVGKKIEKLKAQEQDVSWMETNRMQDDLVTAETLAVLQDALSRQANRIRYHKEMLVAQLSSTFESALVSGKADREHWLAFCKR